jgi:hypothetical protein
MGEANTVCLALAEGELRDLSTLLASLNVYSHLFTSLCLWRAGDGEERLLTYHDSEP